MKKILYLLLMFVVYSCAPDRNYEFVAECQQIQQSTIETAEGEYRTAAENCWNNSPDPATCIDNAASAYGQAVYGAYLDYKACIESHSGGGTAT